MSHSACLIDPKSSETRSSWGREKQNYLSLHGFCFTLVHDAADKKPNKKFFKF